MKIEIIYKKWEDVYEKDVNILYIVLDLWNFYCELGEQDSFQIYMYFYILGDFMKCKIRKREYYYLYLIKI